MQKKQKRYPDPWVYEEERWTREGQAATFPNGWKSKTSYSFTDKGTYVRIILISPEGKKHLYKWRRASIDKEVLEKRGFVVTKRRKPRKLVLR